MRRELFEDYVRTPVAIRSRKSRTMPISIGVHAMLVAVLLVLSTLAGDILPTMPGMLAFVAPPPPPAGVPPAPPAVKRAAAPAARMARPDAAPVTVPSGIKPDPGIEHDPEPASPAGVDGGVPGGLAGDIVSGPSGPPPPPPLAPPSGPMRLSSDIKAPTKIVDVPPVYPYMAQAARVGGVVIIEAVVGRDGRVTDAHILKSIPLLDRAALDAVSQWVYAPTLFNGVPVAVIMTVTVTFAMK